MPPSGVETGLPLETQAGRSGGSVSNEARGNLATRTSEDGKAEVGTVKVFAWPRKVTWKVISVTFLSPMGNSSL